MRRRSRRIVGRLAAVAVLVGMLAGTGGAPAQALSPPAPPGGVPPLDGPPGPEYPTKQNTACQAAGVLPNSDLTQPPPPSIALDLAHARLLSEGAGVTVAILDTGVHPNLRLPNLVGGGDYVVAGGDGLSDCDAHGTLVAGIIGGAGAAGDAFEGTAPLARLISIRVRSGEFSADLPNNSNPNAQTALDIRTTARAIVHAANLGASVIDVSLPVCVDAGQQVDQSMLSAAVGYAVYTRGAVLVAAGGDTGSAGSCAANPGDNPADPTDPRNWLGVKTISTPGWFGPGVLAVGFTNAAGAETEYSLSGPWISLAAPGTAIESLDPGGGGVINGVGAPGNEVPVGGSSFAAAYVAGAVAMLRSRFPTESPSEIADRLTSSAHRPARGVDDSVGAGLIDPVAALGYLTPPKPPADRYPTVRLAVARPARGRDTRPATVATAVIVAAILLGLGAMAVDMMIRRRR